MPFGCHAAIRRYITQGSCGISTFALDFIHSDRRIFKIVDLDEAWLFLQVHFLLFLSLFTVTQAAGLVDDTVSEENLYSLYPLDHYQLDFFVDFDWDWLPGNWDNGVGKQLNARTFHCPVNTVILM